MSNIPDRIDSISLTNLLSLDEQEKAYIQNLLLKIINSQISKDKYYYNKNINIETYGRKLATNVYGIALTNEEYKNLIVAILNEISQDEAVLNLILQKIKMFNSQNNIKTSDIQRFIQDEIEEINTNIFGNGIKIEFYEANGKLVRTRNRTSTK